jgi:hypothetical protein
MLVNKTISAEAKEELYSYNRFIVVSYQWPTLGAAIHMYDVPIVTENQKAVVRFAEYSMRLHLRHRDCPKGKAKAYKTHCFLMHMDDMPRLCRAVRWISILAPSAGTIVIRDRSEPKYKGRDFTDHTVKKKFHMSVRIRSTTYTPMSESLQWSLVSHLSGLRIAGMEVKETALDGDYTLPSRSLQYLQSISGAPYIFVTALAWDMIDIARSLMATANGLVLKGDYNGALERYWNIYYPCSMGLVFSTPDDIFTSDAEEPIVILCRILVDAAASYGLLKLRDHDIRAAAEAESYTHRYVGFMSQFDDRDRIVGFPDTPQATWFVASGAWHLKLLLQLRAELKGDVDWDNFVRSFDQSRKLRPDSPHVAHDYELVKSFRDHSDALVTGDDFLPTSALALPPQIFDFEIPSSIVRPHLTGWTVTEQVEAMIHGIDDQHEQQEGE